MKNIVFLLKYGILFAIFVRFILLSSKVISKNFGNMRANKNSRKVVTSVKNCPNGTLSRPPCFKNYDLDDDVIVYFITPTVAKDQQLAVLTRLEQALRLVSNVFWVVVEIGKKREKVESFLKRGCTRNVYLDIDGFSAEIGETRKVPHEQLARQRGLHWLRNELSKDGHSESVVYFGDEDNAYDLQLFQYMKDTRKVGVWPIAFLRHKFVEKPKIKYGKVVKIDSVDIYKNFDFDIGGMCLNTRLFLSHSNASLLSCDYMGVECLLNDLQVKYSDFHAYGIDPYSTKNRVLVWKTITWIHKGGGNDYGFVI